MHLQRPSMLPNELLETVCNCLDPHDLTVVARAAHHLYPPALRCLYRFLSLTDASAHSVVRTLANRPDIARHVRSFAVAGTPLCPQQLAKALVHMSALVALDLFVDEIEGSVLPISPNSHPQLQHFGASMAVDEHVGAFLHNAAFLHTLHLTSEFAPIASLDTSSFPRLTTLTASASAVAALVPGRPVETVFVTSGDFSEDMVHALAQSTARVAVLSVTTDSKPTLLLASLGQQLPQLVYLQINSTHNLAAPPTTLFHDIAEALALFPSLQSFELSGMCWPSQVDKHDEKRVWQSQPLQLDFEPSEEVDEFYFLW
ncbi:F-box domain-containing protein [Mycena kentingensis (nom. inval.)]|nr:F-box domain-containing protein [Mycena kentingensis (nom. inval.)]